MQIQTKAIVLMLWISLGLLFSGCGSKVVYVPTKCTIEKPQATTKENCREFKSDLEFMQCVARNYFKIQGDYDALSVAFDGCK